jgi:hypothetical protein
MKRWTDVSSPPLAPACNIRINHLNFIFSPSLQEGGWLMLVWFNLWILQI